MAGKVEAKMSNGIPNGDSRSPKFPEDATYDDIYWSLWWFGTGGWIKPVGRIIWTLFNNLYVIPAHVIYMAIFSPLCLIGGESGKQLFWSIEETFFGWVLGHVACWSYTAKYKVIESGDSLDDILHQSFLFLPNHQSTADVPLCMTIFASRHGYPDKVMWIMDKVFKFTNFGIVSWLHDDFFILAGKDNRGKSLEELKDHLTRVFVKKKRQCLVLFPEGGFLRKRKPISHRFALKNDLPLLEYCTLPRTGALEVIMQVIGPEEKDVVHQKSLSDKVSQKGSGGSQNELPQNEINEKQNKLNSTNNSRTETGTNSSQDSQQIVTNNNQTKWNTEQYFRSKASNEYSGTLDKIVDVTIAYPDGKPLGLFDILSAWREPCAIHVHYKIYDIKELPSDPEELRQWMYKLYFEKEKLLEDFYRTGRFPRSGSGSKNVGNPRELMHDPMRFLLLHFFFIASTCIFWLIGSNIYSYIIGNETTTTQS